jgi:uncharacterized membrane protein (DUF485 family)
VENDVIYLVLSVVLVGVIGYVHAWFGYPVFG